MLCFPPGNESYGRQIRHKSVIKMFAETPTEAVRVVGQANGSREGSSAANLKAAELYVGAFKELAKVKPIKKSLRFIILPRSKKLSTANTNCRTLRLNPRFHLSKSSLTVRFLS